MQWVSLQLLANYGAREVLVKIGYAIGKAEPVLQVAWVDGVAQRVQYYCRPQAIINRLALRRPIYLDLARNGHFGRGAAVAWEGMT